MKQQNLSVCVYLDVIQKALLIRLDALHLHLLGGCEIGGNCTKGHGGIGQAASQELGRDDRMSAQ